MYATAVIEQTHRYPKRMRYHAETNTFVETEREIEDYGQLSEAEKEDLHRLYPRIGQGEGFFGREKAWEIYEKCGKPL